MRFLSRRLGSDHEAEDVLQEFYLKAIGKAEDVQKDESIVAWLYRVLSSTLSDHFRKRERRARLESAYAREQPAHEAPADTELHAMVCECLYGLLPTLRPDYAAILWRVNLLGEPRQQGARTLGLTANNLSVRLHRARQAMKRALSRSCETCPEHGFFDCACDLPIRRLAAAAPMGTRGSS